MTLLTGWKERESNIHSSKVKQKVFCHSWDVKLYMQEKYEDKNLHIRLFGNESDITKNGKQMLDQHKGNVKIQQFSVTVEIWYQNSLNLHELHQI